MVEASLFVPFLGLFSAIKYRKSFSKAMGCLLAFFINVLWISFLLLVIRKYADFSSFEILGHYPLCNRRLERGICIEGVVFPLCFRCTFLYLGLYATILGLLVLQPKPRWHVLLIAFILIIPCVFDGFAQMLTDYESTNIKRLLTGVFAGIGISIWIYSPVAKMFE